MAPFPRTAPPPQPIESTLIVFKHEPTSSQLPNRTSSSTTRTRARTQNSAATTSSPPRKTTSTPKTLKKTSARSKTTPSTWREPSLTGFTSSTGLRTISASDQATLASSSITAGAPTSTVAPYPPSAEWSDMPHWAIHLIAGWLSFALVAAIMIHFVNFPPKITKRNRRPNCNLKRKDGHQPEEYEMLNYSKPQAICTSAQSPALVSPLEAIEPQQLRKRGKVKNLSIDTSGQYRGLAIALHGGEHERHPSPVIKPRKFVDSFGSSTGIPSSHGSTSPLMKSFSNITAPHRAVKHTRSSSTKAAAPSSPSSHHRNLTWGALQSDHDIKDIESGLLQPHSQQYRPVDKPSRLTPYTSPNRSPKSSPSSSAVRLALEKVGDGIEWGAEKVTMLLHEQVRKGQWEEGLLLPIRREERGGDDDQMHWRT